MGRKWPQVPRSVPFNHNSRTSRWGICQRPQRKRKKYFKTWHEVILSLTLCQLHFFYTISTEPGSLRFIFKGWLTLGTTLPGLLTSHTALSHPHAPTHTCAHTHIHGVKLQGEESTCLCSSAFYTLFSCTRSTFSLSHSVPTCFPFCSPHFSPLSPTFNLPFTSSFFSYSSTPPPTLCRLQSAYWLSSAGEVLLWNLEFLVWLMCYVKNGTVMILEFIPFAKMKGMQVRPSKTVDQQSLKLLLGCTDSIEPKTGCICGKTSGHCRQQGCRLYNIR